MKKPLQPFIAEALLGLVPGADLDTTRVSIEYAYTQLDVRSVNSWAGGVDGLACRIANHLQQEKDTAATATATSTPLTLGRAQAFIEAATALDEFSMVVEQQIKRREVGPLTALQDAADLLRRMAGVIQSRTVLVYRAAHDVIVAGTYTTAEAAQHHCEVLVSREHPADVVLTFDWLADENDFAIAELVVQLAGGDEVETGYTVTPIEVHAAYDADADE